MPQKVPGRRQVWRPRLQSMQSQASVSLKNTTQPKVWPSTLPAWVSKLELCIARPSHTNREKVTFSPPLSSVLSWEFCPKHINSVFGKLIEDGFALSSCIHRMISDNCLHLNPDCFLPPHLELSLLSHTSNCDVDLSCQPDSNSNQLKLNLLGIPTRGFLNQIT